LAQRRISTPQTLGILRVKFLSAVFLTLVAFDCAACAIPPFEQSVPSAQLIARSKNIVLAKAVNVQAMANGEVRYAFEVTKQIAGSTPGKFQLVGVAEMLTDDQKNFNHHTDTIFWKSSIGRFSNDTDCQIHPSFLMGREYLVFLDAPYHNRSFELIIRTSDGKYKKDQWLQYVEDKIKARQVVKPGAKTKTKK
jgi:hypothetical protein